MRPPLMRGKLVPLRAARGMDDVGTGGELGLAFFFAGRVCRGGRGWD